MKRLKIGLGLTLMPLFAALYYNDKVIMFVLPHLKHEPIHKWFTNQKEMSNSLIRVIVFWLSIGLYHLVNYVFGVFA